MTSPSSNLSSQWYADFRARFLPATLSLRERADFQDPIPVSEKLVQAIWADQLFDPAGLVTRDGQSLRILNPGRWNAEGGPDFRGVRIHAGNLDLRGDAEVHLHTTGWNDHRHGLDPAYNGVILDVCLWEFGPDTPIHTQKGQTVFQLVLHSRLQGSLEELAESLDPDRYPFSPNRRATRPSPLLQLPRDEVSACVDSAGIYRFEQKTARIGEIISRHGADEAAYQLLAEALGYKHNKLAFRQTALALPMAALLRLPSPDARIEALIAEADRQPLRLSQVRPANHPHRRLAALALLAGQHTRPAEWFLSLVSEPARLKKVPEATHAFWSWHYHRGGKRLAKPLALLGAARWKEIVINAVLPFCAAAAHDRGGSDGAEKAFRIYREFPGSQSNRACRQIAYDLGLPAPTKTLQQQGLIQMYQDFDLLLPDS